MIELDWHELLAQWDHPSSTFKAANKYEDEMELYCCCYSYNCAIPERDGILTSCLSKEKRNSATC